MQNKPAYPNRAATPASQADEGAGELLNVLRALWQRKIIIVLTAGSCLLAAAIYCFCSTPLYRAVATIEVAPQEQNVIRIEDVSKLSLNQLDVLNTLVLKSARETIFRRVMVANDLTHNAGFYVDGLPPSAAGVLSQMAAEVKGTLRRNTRLIDIVAVHPDAQMANLLANGVANQFIRQEVEDQNAATRFANVSLLEEADRLQGEVERSQRLLQNYREEHKTVSLEDRLNIVDQKFHSLAQELNDAKAELTQMLAQQEQARASTNIGDLLALPAVKKDAVVAGLQEQIAQQETLVNFYTMRYREKYPKMIEARQRLDELKRSVAAAGAQARQTLDSVVEAARSREKGLERALAEAQAESLALSKLAIDYNMLQRQVDSNQNLYQAILQRLKETEVSKGIEKTSLQIIEAAATPITPFRPNRPLLLILGLLGGVALGVGLALLMAQFDQSVQSAENAEQRLGLPVLGMLPFDRRLAQSSGVLVMNGESILAEGFRSLRASIATSGRPEDHKVVLVTSSIDSEGKTMSSSNYALALAQQSVRTVLIDLDFRRPQLCKAFAMKTDARGVSDFLLGQATLEEVVHPSGFENLDIIPAGRQVPNPAEQLAGQWLAQLLQEVRQRYEVAVLDTAPIQPVADTLSFVRLADMVLLAVCGRYTSFKTVQRSITILERAGVRPAGLILNRIVTRQNYYGYSYYERKQPEASAGFELVQPRTLNTLRNAANTTNNCSME